MTLIGATKIKDKWTILSDSAVTIGQTISDANQTYRPKIREINGKNITLITAGCGTIRDIDYTLNNLEKTIYNKKFKTKNELKFFLQDILAIIFKELKELSGDPQFELIILEPKTDTLFVCEGYGITEPKDCASIVLGTGDTKFYKSYKINEFFEAFKHAVECDEYCDFPIISYRDGDTNVWYGLENFNDFYKLVGNNEPENQTTIYPEYDSSKRYICSGADKAL